MCAYAYVWAGRAGARPRGAGRMEDRVGGGDAVRRRLEREVIDRRLDRVAPRLAWDLYYYKSELLRAPLLPPQFFSREVYQIADDHSFPKYYRTTNRLVNILESERGTRTRWNGRRGRAREQQRSRE